MRAESAVEPTKSENITVTWRRSAVSLEAGSGAVGADAWRSVTFSGDARAIHQADQSPDPSVH